MKHDEKEHNITTSTIPRLMGEVNSNGQWTEIHLEQIRVIIIRPEGGGKRGGKKPGAQTLSVAGLQVKTPSMVMPRRSRVCPGTRP